MKTSIDPITLKLGPVSRIKILTLAAALMVPAATGLAQTMWTDGTADFNIPGNWNGTYIDVGTSSPNPNCDNDTGSNNIILIQPGDPAWYHGDTLAGQGNGTSGSYIQTGSTNFTGYPANGNWLRMGIGSGSYGSYVLSNGVVFTAGRTQLGESGTGYLEVDGGVYNTGYNGNPGIVCGQGDSGPGTGTLVLNGGTINNINNETWIGEANGGTHDKGYLFINGGAFNPNNWFVFGRNDGGVGVGIMTAGTITLTGGGQFLVGGGGNGTLIQSGGTINVFNQYLVPQSGNTSTDMGTNILSGTAVLNAHDWIAVGRDGGYGELDISGGASITRDNASDGGANFTVGSGGPGLLNQNGGNITNNAGDTFIGEAASGTWNLNSGVANLGTTFIGYTSGGNGTLNLNGGTFLASSLTIGNGGVGTMSFNSGTANVGPIVICANTGNGTLNLNGGTLQTSGIKAGSSSAVSTLNLNGGTLQATANNQNFLSGLILAFAGPSTTIIDSQNYTITASQQIQDNGGGLIKVGSGILALTGQNSYSGNTVISNGTLIVVTGTGTSGNYVAEDNTAFGIILGSANGQVTAPAVTLGNSLGAAVDFNLGGFGNPSSAPLSASAVTASGTITINITEDSSPLVGQFPLIQSSSAIAGSGHFVLGSLPTGVSASLVTTATTVSLNITAVNLPIWAGLAGGTWDLSGTTNWVDVGSGLPISFINGDLVLFNDTAPGTTNVNLTTTVSPAGITVNNSSLNYTFYGTGSISGSGGLTKEGSSSLAILNPAGNSYTGPTVIAGGTLLASNLANGGSPSAIGSSSAASTNLVLAGGVLDYVGPAASINRGYTAANTNGTLDLVTVSNVTFSGSVAVAAGAGFTKAGPGQLAYTGSGVSTLSDTLGYQVESGTVSFGGSGTNNIGGNLNLAVSNNLTATLIVTNNVTLNLSGGGLFDIADSEVGLTTNNGTVNQSGGTINLSSSYSTFIGQFTNSLGVYNLSGGTFNANNWIAIGRDNGTGTLNLSGTGAFNLVNGNGGNLDIGNSG
ncbi:MAG TPA: autotransporter-associated beta strand repeat-containing protein, partial [Verrucomicrobiae bacterium]